MYPENPEGTQVIIGSMNMRYDVYPTLPEIKLTNCFVPSAQILIRPHWWNIFWLTWVFLERSQNFAFFSGNHTRPSQLLYYHTTVIFTIFEIRRPDRIKSSGVGMGRRKSRNQHSEMDQKDAWKTSGLHHTTDAPISQLRGQDEMKRRHPWKMRHRDRKGLGHVSHQYLSLQKNIIWNFTKIA